MLTLPISPYLPSPPWLLLLFLEEAEGSESSTRTQRAQSGPGESHHVQQEISLQQSSNKTKPMAEQRPTPSAAFTNLMSPPEPLGGRVGAPECLAPVCTWMVSPVTGGHSWNPPQLIVSYSEELRKQPFSSWDPKNEWAFMYFLFVHKNSVFGVFFFFLPPISSFCGMPWKEINVFHF